MAATGFRVTPEQLRKSAAVVDSNTKSYSTEYNSIYTAVQELRVQWKGISSDTFNQQLESFRNDFKQLETILNGYRDSLITIAKQYETVENQQRDKAAKLSSGI